MIYTPEIITTLKPNEVFVFGSNNQGKHGKGAAKLAHEKFGAIYGTPVGLQGQSYAIVTKDLRIGKKSMPIEYIEIQIRQLYSFAKLTRPDLTFLVTKIGCGLGGYKVDEIAPLFKQLPKFPNIILPKEFTCDN